MIEIMIIMLIASLICFCVTLKILMTSTRNNEGDIGKLRSLLLVQNEVIASIGSISKKLKEYQANQTDHR